MYLFPNVNMQDLNLDWILNQIKEMAASISDQAGKNAQALALTVEQSTLMKGFLSYFPEGTFSWTEDEHGIITSITVLKPINDVINDVCDDWLAVQGQSIQTALGRVDTAVAAAEEATSEAQAASENYVSIKTALVTALDLLHAVNSAFNAGYTFQYLDDVNKTTDERYVYNNETGKVETAALSGSTRYPVVYNLPSGVYAITGAYHRNQTLSSTYPYDGVYFENITTGEVHGIMEWVYTSGQTVVASDAVYIPYNFNLYFTGRSADSTISFTSNVRKETSFGLLNYGVSDLEDLKYDFKCRKQYLKLSQYSNYNNVKYEKLANGRICVKTAGASTPSDYVVLPPVRNLPAGTYTFRYLRANSLVIMNGDVYTLTQINGGSTVSFSTQYTVTLDYNFDLFPNTSTNASTGSTGATAYFINGDNSRIPPITVEGTYYNSFTEINDTVEHVNNVISSVDPSPLFMRPTCYTVGHQGNQILAPRNTAPAYIIARRMGCLAGENDLQVTSNGTYVMYHGGTLKYTNKAGTSNLVTLNGKDIYIEDGTYLYLDGSTYKILATDAEATVTEPVLVDGQNVTINQTHYDDLCKISFGACFSEEYTNVPVLTFEQYVLLSKKLGLGINLDNKIGYTDARLEYLYKTLKAYGMEKTVRWGSINNAHNADLLRSYDPDAVISVGLEIEDETTEAFQARVTAWKVYNTNNNVIFSAEGSYDAEAAQEADRIVISRSKIAYVHDEGFDVSGYIIQTGLTDAQYKAVMNGLVECGVISITCDNHTVHDLYQDLRNSY